MKNWELAHPAMTQQIPTARGAYWSFFGHPESKFRDPPRKQLGQFLFLPLGTPFEKRNQQGAENDAPGRYVEAAMRHTHTHTHILSISLSLTQTLSLTHTHTLSLSLSLSLSRTHLRHWTFTLQVREGGDGRWPTPNHFRAKREQLRTF